MQPDVLREKWEEICYILSKNINLNITEDIYEQKVLMVLEKLGWSQFRKEIEIRPSLQIGRQGFIQPDIVIYTQNKKAEIVVEVKRPMEDITKDSTVGQLKSYMRQLKADFGLLIGKKLHIYYDGNLNPHNEPLPLAKIPFDCDSSDGKHFVEIFDRNNFLERAYTAYLKEWISQFEKSQKIQELKKRLLSEDTKQRIREFLSSEYEDEFGADIAAEAMKSLIIDLGYDSNPFEVPATNKMNILPSHSQTIPAIKKEFTIYNHRVNSMGGRIDELIIEGKHTVDEIVEKIGSEFGRDEAKAKAKFHSHLRHLKSGTNHDLNISTEGKVRIVDKKNV